MIRPLFLAVLIAPPAVAQSTDTERAAAGQVLSDITALETRIGPGALAARLAGAPNSDKAQVLAKAAAVWDGEMQSLSDWIGHHPEVGWKEVKSVDTLTAVLRARGFKVETGVAGLATAFVATWTSPAGAGPAVGVI